MSDKEAFRKLAWDLLFHSLEYIMEEYNLSDIGTVSEQEARKRGDGTAIPHLHNLRCFSACVSESRR